MSTIFSEWKSRVFLFKIRQEDFGQVPIITEVTDSSWSPPDLAEIVRYLREAPVIAVTTTCSPIVCPLCHATLDPLCSAQQSDGHYYWFHTLSHYVKVHNVRLPDRMVEHIRSRQNDPLGTSNETAEPVV